MKSIFLGGAAIALGLVSATASAQPGAESPASSPPGGSTSATLGEGGAGITAGADARTALNAGANAGSPGSDLKRSTRKSRRDITNGTVSGTSVNGQAAVPTNAQSSPTGGGT